MTGEEVFVANSCAEERSVEIYRGERAGAPDASGTVPAASIGGFRGGELSSDDEVWTFVVLGPDGANSAVEVDPDDVVNSTLLIAALGC